MFGHREERTLIHNLKLASLLACIAGMVNISGLLSVHFLTTNITGHFALFGKSIVDDGLALGLVFAHFVLAFFAGAFFSGLLMEVRAKRGNAMIGTLPVLLECVLFLVLAIIPFRYFNEFPYQIAALLLFAMGLQNAIVTTISKSIVRTTHLTGLFTDLGIELSQLIFYKHAGQQKKLLSSIKLHVSIIVSFLLGIVAGGYLFKMYNNKVFIVTAILLLLGLVGRRLFKGITKMKSILNK